MLFFLVSLCKYRIWYRVDECNDINSYVISAVSSLLGCGKGEKPKVIVMSKRR